MTGKRDSVEATTDWMVVSAGSDCAMEELVVVEVFTPYRPLMCNRTSAGLISDRMNNSSDSQDCDVRISATGDTEDGSLDTGLWYSSTFMLLSHPCNWSASTLGRCDGSFWKHCRTKSYWGNRARGMGTCSCMGGGFTRLVVFVTQFVAWKNNSKEASHSIPKKMKLKRINVHLGPPGNKLGDVNGTIHVAMQTWQGTKGPAAPLCLPRQAIPATPHIGVRVNVRPSQ